MISKKSNGEPFSIEINGSTINDPQQAAEHFAGYLTKIGQKVQQDKSQSLKSFHRHELRGGRGGRFAFEFEKCYSEELLKIVGCISSNSAGIDGKNLQTSCILYIINLSLETGIFPEGLKTADVIPLHKGGARSDA